MIRVRSQASPQNQKSNRDDLIWFLKVKQN